MLRAIEFEPRPELTDRFDRIMEGLSERDTSLSDAASEHHRNVAQHAKKLHYEYYKKRLHEAEELITSVIHVRSRIAK